MTTAPALLPTPETVEVMEAQRWGLTNLQYRFCLEYVRNPGAATPAVRRAGYNVTSDNSAAIQATRLLRNAKIRACLRDLQANVAELAQIAPARVLTEQARLAFTDIGDYLSWDARGNLTFTPSDALTAAQRAAVKRVTVKRKRLMLGNADGGVDEWEIEEASLELHDKQAALTKIMQNLGMLPRPGITVNVDNRQQQVDIALIDQIVQDVRRERGETDGRPD